jgi:LacI family transcriptional regulator
MTTVSRVLNGVNTVDPQLVERVRFAMESLKYQPNRAARMLAGSRSGHLGLLVTDMQNPFFIDLICGVEEVVQQNGYLLIMCNTAEDPRKEEQYLEILAAESVAGVVIVPTREHSQALEVLKTRCIPIVAVDRRIRDRSIDAVLIDNVVAAKEAVTHLLARGYQRVGLITGPLSTTTARERLLGYHQALQEAHIPLDPLLEQHGPYNEEIGLRLTQKLLDLDPPVQALLTANNRLTVGTLRALHARHKTVPGDVALVGFDEVHWAIPDLVSITTVTQPAYELGRTAASRLFQRLRQPDGPRQEIMLQYQLLIRESSSPRPSFSPKFSPN